jgi:hypothetical protein
MSMYVEGTSRGLLKVRDIENEGELVMHIPADFSESNSVSVLGYNNDKNVLFAGGKDGNFRIWKVAHEWRSKNAEQAERAAYLKINEERNELAKKSVQGILNPYIK